MKDAFDQSPKPVEPEKKESFGMTPAAQRKLFERTWKNKWLSFTHPTHGVVAAQCLEAKFHSVDKDKYPTDDYSLKVQGRTGAILDIMLLESSVQFHTTKEQAVNETTL